MVCIVIFETEMRQCNHNQKHGGSERCQGNPYVPWTGWLVFHFTILIVSLLAIEAPGYIIVVIIVVFVAVLDFSQVQCF
jgi:L-asparagine transporter-like permease